MAASGAEPMAVLVEREHRETLEKMGRGEKTEEEKLHLEVKEMEGERERERVALRRFKLRDIGKLGCLPLKDQMSCNSTFQEDRWRLEQLQTLLL